MRPPRTRTFAAVITAALYVLVAAWPLGCVCAGMLGPAEATQQSHGCGEPRGKAPCHGESGGPASDCSDSIPCSCHCLCGSLVGSRYYLPQIGITTISAEVHGYVYTLSMPATIAVALVAQRHMMPPASSAFQENPFELSSTVLRC